MRRAIVRPRYFVGRNGDRGAQDWQLASGHWVERKFDMVIAHPRPSAETAVYEQHRNAYTGLAWDTRVLVYGGAYPFRFELVTGPSGMTIGEKLVASGDVLVEPSNYGKLEWSNPTAGDHTVTVRVYDQDYNRGGNPSGYAEVSFTLTVGTSNWVFIDPVSGDNGNSGAIGSPFLDTTPFITGSTYANKLVMVRAGTMNLVGMGGGNYTANANAPKVFVGYPGETATINFDTGHFVASIAGFCLRAIALHHDDTTYGSSQKAVSMISADRHIVSDCSVTQFKNGTESSGNPGVFVMLATAAAHDYPCFAYNTLTGVQGPGWHSYSAKYGVCHGNTWANCTFSQADSSNLTVIYCKAATYGVSIRKNEIWNTNTHPAGGVTEGVVGMNGQIESWSPTYGIEFLEICYNTFYFDDTGGRAAALREGKNDFDAAGVSDIHIYRNSIFERDNAEWNGTPVYSSTRQRNVLTGGSALDPADMTDSDNLDSGTYLDSSMKLTGAHRTAYLGTHGAEVA